MNIFVTNVCPCCVPLYAAPVSEAKAQGVVMPEPELASEINRLIGLWDAQVGWSGQCMEELLDHAAKAATFIARLNATTVQQVSVPQCFTKLLHHAHGMTFGADWNKGTMAGYHREPLGKAVVQCQAWLAAALSAPAADGWIPVSERLPDSGSTVIAYYLNSYGKGRTIRAQHVEAWTIEAEDVADVDTDCVEYSEQDDCYYLLQGWYECIDNWDEYYRVAVTEGPITHWMPLPAAPIKIEDASHDQ